MDVRPIKFIFTIFLAGSSGLGTAGLASAYSLSPPHSKLRPEGVVTIKTPGGSGQCEVKFIGSSGKGNNHSGNISRALFGGASRCELFGSVPWQIKVTSATQATISNFGFVGQAGPCGPADVTVTINSSGVWTFNAPLPGGCRFSGSLPTKPPITIAP